MHSPVNGRNKGTRWTLIASLVVAALTLWQQRQPPSDAAPERRPSAAAKLQLPRQRSVDGVRIVDQQGAVVYTGRVDLQDTLERIAAGEHYPHRNDGAVFQNRPAPGEHEPALPQRPPGYYHEYVHPTPGVAGPGPQRVILGQSGEWYYTPDHYASFTKLH